MIKKYGDIIAGSFIIIVSVSMYVASFNIKMLTVSRIGAAFVPQLTAVLFAITGLIILAGGIKTLKAGNTDAKSSSQTGPARLHAVLATLILIFLYVLLLEKIGFIIMTALYLFAQIYILAGKSERKIPVFIVTAVLVSVVIYFVFVNAFQLMLPEGILELN